MRLTQVPALVLSAVLFGVSVTTAALSNSQSLAGGGAAAALSIYAKARVAHLNASGMQVVGQAPPTELIQLVLLPKYDHENELGSLVTAQSTVGNALYHHFLTGSQFKAYFGPSQSTLKALFSALQTAGFHLDRVSSSGDLVVASGSAATVEKLFGIPLYSVRRADGSIRHANLDDYSVPEALTSSVHSLIGLDSATEAVPMYRVLTKPAYSFGGATPQQLEAANDMPVLHGYRGSYNQVLAVLVDGRPNPSDVSTFLAHYGISDSYPLHQINTGNGQVGGDKNEATLDVETISATAPGAYLDLYTMPDLTSNSILQGINSFTNSNGSGNSATLSMSFGGCDNADKNYDNSLYQETNTGISKGQTFVASTGDNGVGHCNGSQSGPANEPASDPLVLAVGGTSPDSEYPVVWQGGTHGQYGWVGSGGGSSSYYGKPPFQNRLGCGSRCVPDIALPADPSGGLIVYCSSGCFYAGYFALGGTSLSSPLAAASLAEISQKRGSGHHGRRSPTPNRRSSASCAPNLIRQSRQLISPSRAGNNECATGPVPGIDALYEELVRIDWYLRRQQCRGHRLRRHGFGLPRRDLISPSTSVDTRKQRELDHDSCAICANAALRAL